MLVSCSFVFSALTLLTVLQTVPIRFDLAIQAGFVAVLLAGIFKAGRTLDRIETRQEENAKTAERMENFNTKKFTEFEAELKSVKAEVENGNKHNIRVEGILARLQEGQATLANTVTSVVENNHHRDERVARNEEKIEALGGHLASFRADTIKDIEGLGEEINRLREWRHGLTNEAAVELIKEEHARRRALHTQEPYRE